MRHAIEHLRRRARDLDEQAKTVPNGTILAQTSLTLEMVAQALEVQDWHDQHDDNPLAVVAHKEEK